MFEKQNLEQLTDKKTTRGKITHLFMEEADAKNQISK